MLTAPGCGKVSNEVLNNSLKLPKDLVHPQGARVPNAPVIGPETTVSCCRPISTPQILPVLPLPLFPGWDLQIFQGVFLIMSSSPKGEKGRCVSVGTPYFHNFAPASPPSPPPLLPLLLLLHIEFPLSSPVGKFWLCSYLNLPSLALKLLPCHSIMSKRKLAAL